MTYLKVSISVYWPKNCIGRPQDLVLYYFEVCIIYVALVVAYNFHTENFKVFLIGIFVDLSLSLLMLQY